MSKTWNEDLNECGCKKNNPYDKCKKKSGCIIEINNILVCSGKERRYSEEYEIEDGDFKNSKDSREFESSKKGITIVNKLSCSKCHDKDDDDD